MSTKFDRSHYEPGLIEITIGALLSVLIGVVLCAAWLVLKPVQVVRELPKEPVAGEVYFVEGRVSSGSAREWMAKWQQFVTRLSVALDESELNAAYRAKLAEAEKVKKDEPKTEPGLITPGQLNFRINDGVLQVGAPVELRVFGFTKNVQVFAQGVFEHADDRYVYTPDAFYLGSLRVDKIPALGGMIKSRLWSTLQVPDDVADAWGRLGEVKLEGTQLHLIMP